MNISVTRALAELKRLDDRIARSSNQVFVSATFGKDNAKRVYNSNKTVQDTEAELTGNFQSVLKLIENRALLKRAIVLSNAKTQIKLGDKTMTVAEAIELKQSISHKENLVAHLRQQVLTNQRLVDTQNANLDAEINKLVTSVYGADKTKVSTETYDLVAKPQKDAKEFALFDPNNAVEQIKKLEEDISLVKTELDFVLSESNSRTEIAVDF